MLVVFHRSVAKFKYVGFICIGSGRTRFLSNVKNILQWVLTSTKFLAILGQPLFFRYQLAIARTIRLYFRQGFRVGFL